MGKPSRGVVAVGGLSFDRVRARYDPSSGADGSALRAAVGAWLVGVDAAVCAVIGSDFPTELIVGVTRAGVDVSRVRLAPDPDAVLGADREPLPEQLASLGPRWSVHICGLTPVRQREILRAVNQRVALITLDTGQRSGKVEPAVELAASADAFLPGQRDLAPLWPGIPPQDALRGLVRRGVRTAVIKLGTSGSMGIHDGAITSMPAYPVTASGTTGGGDAYAGAFSAMFAADRDLPRAMAWASAAASVVVESFATLDPLNEFGRGKVAYRARILEAEARVRNDFARTSEAESSTRFALP
ncbi:MAG TPA: PfkB family carbohydrate kinase [Candidatus Dormibacteraeota bacterium]